MAAWAHKRVIYYQEIQQKMKYRVKLSKTEIIFSKKNDLTGKNHNFSKRKTFIYLIS